MQGCSCVLDCDLLLFPIHYKHARHWAMASVDLRDRRLLYWDSLSPGQLSGVGVLAVPAVLEGAACTTEVPCSLHRVQDGAIALGHIARWVGDEARDKLRTAAAERRAQLETAPLWEREVRIAHTQHSSTALSAFENDMLMLLPGCAFAGAPCVTAAQWHGLRSVYLDICRAGQHGPVSGGTQHPGCQCVARVLHVAHNLDPLLFSGAWLLAPLSISRSTDVASAISSTPACGCIVRVIVSGTRKIMLDISSCPRPRPALCAVDMSAPASNDAEEEAVQVPPPPWEQTVTLLPAEDSEEEDLSLVRLLSCMFTQ